MCACVRVGVRVRVRVYVCARSHALPGAVANPNEVRAEVVPVVPDLTTRVG
jgi:hypothetical protein